MIIEIITDVSMLLYSDMMLSILVNMRVYQHSKEPVFVIFDHEDEILGHI